MLDKIEKHYSPAQVAEISNVKESTLAAWRHRSKKEPTAPARGPAFTKIGRLVRYSESSVLLWLSQREHVATPANN